MMQMNRRAETIILPLELLRHLKSSEFNDPQEYHAWQKRQLKILEAGLLRHPSVPLEKSNPHAARFREIFKAAQAKAIDTGKNSELMKGLINSVVSLAWRSPDGSPVDVSHWADGYPFNVHIYIALLGCIFDLKDETRVLDEVDELLELMKKTWSTLGINKAVHNLCFTWVLFEQYFITSQVEPDLLGASLAMLGEVANDAKKADKDPLYVKMLANVMTSMKQWSEKKLLAYHENFDRGSMGLMEAVLPLVFSATKILEEDVPGYATTEKIRAFAENYAGNRVDKYIRSSIRDAFTKMLEERNINAKTLQMHEASQTLIQLADGTEELAVKERVMFSPVLKKWHPVAAGVAAVALHECYGTLLKQYLAGVTSLTNETVLLLQKAGKLEKVLFKMVAEDTEECEDGGKAMIREMASYEVDSVVITLLRQWIQEKLKKSREIIQRAKDTETWNPKSKNEPYAQSAVELMRQAKEVVDSFFEIPVSISEDFVRNLADGFEQIVREYITFIVSCGSKQSYIPALPPLTRCSQDSRFFKMWKRAASRVGIDSENQKLINEGNHPRPSTSRGTQRLYIRLNTLHYILSHLNSLEKSLALNPRVVPSPRRPSCSYFDQARSTVQVACQIVSEIAAYRLIFLDSNSVFYGSLYLRDVENSRIRPALRILKQNLTLLCAIVTERATPMAIKEVMKACFEAFLMVLLAGGSSRVFTKADHELIEEDFDNLKRLFYTCGEGLMPEDVVDKEAQAVEGVVALMGQSTQQLVENFSLLACEASGIGLMGPGQKLPMPPTTGRWHRSDPNTILRVLCYRNDKVANHFLKKSFQLAKRRG
nr:protein unc-13 homolog [Ipomoea batatas]GMD65603.1 protein unc-13 homolog [Ipomoea batatas]